MVRWHLTVLLSCRWICLSHCKCTFKVVTQDYIKAKNNNLSKTVDYPLIVKGGVRELTAQGSSADDFVRNLGNMSVALSQNIELQSKSIVKSEVIRVSIKDWISSLPDEDSEFPKYTFSFLNDIEHRNLDRKLLAMYATPDYLQPWSLNRFISMGSKSKGVALHKHVFSWVGLLAGKKMWYVFPPDAVSADFSFKHHSQRELKKKPQVQFCAQEASDLVFIPSFWWHATFDMAKWTVGLGSQDFKGVPATHLSWEVSIGNASALKKQMFIATEELLQIASHSGHEEVVKLLIKKRAPLGNSMLTAASGGHLPIMKLLLSHRASSTVVDESHNHLHLNSALESAVELGRADCVEFLLRQRADPNTYERAREFEGTDGDRSPLRHASIFGHSEVANRLIDAGAHKPELKKETPAINFAAHMGHGTTLRTLINRGAHPPLDAKLARELVETAHENGHQNLLDTLTSLGIGTGRVDL